MDGIIYRGDSMKDKLAVPGKLGVAMGGLLLAVALSGSAMAQEKKATPETKAMPAEGECHGTNACKGQGACGGKGHSCAGKNACKGQGWNKMTEAQCKEKGGTFNAPKS
jgi:hypothetical protein